jgi:hypothetical protein
VAGVRIHHELGVRQVLRQDEALIGVTTTSLFPCTTKAGWRILSSIA